MLGLKGGVAAIALGVALAGQAHAGSLTIFVDETQSRTLLGGNNAVLQFNLDDLTSATPVTALSWDLTITTFGFSEFDEARIWIGKDRVSYDGGFTFAPCGPDAGPGEGNPQTRTQTCTGAFPLSDPRYQLDLRGLTLLEFYETFDDAGNGTNAYDAIWNGTITFTFDDPVVVPGPGGIVPEPATWAMLVGGFGLVGGAMRRRRTVAALA